MKVARLLAAVVAVVALVAVAGVQAREEKKDNAKLIQGAWEITKSFDGGPPAGTAVTFGKDGKYTAEGKDVKHEGTWKVDGTALTIVLKAGEKDITINLTIKSVTDTDAVIEKEAGKTVELKKKK